MHRFTLICLLVLTAITARPQRIATLTIDLSRPMSGIATPISIDLDSLTDLPVSSLILVLQTRLAEDFSVPFQLDTIAGRRILHWIVDPFQTTNVTYLHIRSQDPGIRSPEPFPLTAFGANGELTVAHGQHKLGTPGPIFCSKATPSIAGTSPRRKVPNASLNSPLS